MIQVVVSHFEYIFCYLTNRNCFATIQMAEWHLEVIFCFLTNPTLDFGEVEKSMFQVVARHGIIIFFFLSYPNVTWMKLKKRCFKGSNVLWTHFRPLDQHNKCLGWGRKGDVSKSRMAFSNYYRPLDYLKMPFHEDEKAMIQVVVNHEELIFILLTRQECDLDEFETSMFQGLERHLKLFSASGLA